MTTKFDDLARRLERLEFFPDNAAGGASNEAHEEIRQIEDRLIAMPAPNYRAVAWKFGILSRAIANEWDALQTWALLRAIEADVCRLA